MKTSRLLISPLLWLMLGCIYEPAQVIEPMIVVGYAPVYGTESQKAISIQAPRPVESPGKIYLYQEYLFVNELQRGIHVFNNANPTDPEAIAFIEILGNSEMVIKDDVLYVNHMGDVVALALSDFDQVKELGRHEGNYWMSGVPAPSGFHFECIEPSKGFVVSWKKVELVNPQCYAF